MSAPAHTISERGFAHPVPIRGTDNGGVRVYESSGARAYWPEIGDDGQVTQGEAEGPFVWVRVWQQNHVDGPRTEAAAHLTLEAAEALRDQLTWLIERMGEQSPKCPRCGSPDPTRHPAVQWEGEVHICPHSWHASAGPR